MAEFDSNGVLIPESLLQDRQSFLGSGYFDNLFQPITPAQQAQVSYAETHSLWQQYGLPDLSFSGIAGSNPFTNSIDSIANPNINFSGIDDIFTNLFSNPLMLIILLMAMRRD